jgi:exopolysaccharide production protein ExoQ
MLKTEIESGLKRKPRLAEMIFTVASLVLLQGGFLGFLGTGDPTDPSSGVLLLQAIWACIYATVFFLLARHRKDVAIRLFKPSWVGALLSLALLSAMWSTAPILTMRRGVAVIGTSIFGVYLASRYETRMQLCLLASSFSIGAAASLAFAVLGLGTCPVLSTHDTGWCGIFLQKNRLGESMALAVPVFILLARAAPSGKMFLRCCGVGCLVLLLISDSKTFLVASLACLPLLFCGSALRGNGIRLLRSVAAIVLVVFSAVFAMFRGVGLADAANGITSTLGRNITLTGRLELWVLSTVMALRRPWLGYGYNGFWLGFAGPSAAIWRVLYWKPVYAHNGILELWLDLGLLGVAVFACGYVIQVVRATRHMRRNSSAEALWPLTLIVFMTFCNFTESSLLATNDLLWALYVGTFVALSPQCVISADKRFPAAERA